MRIDAIRLLTVLAAVQVSCGKPSAADHDRARARMVARDLAGRGIEDPAVLTAMGRVLRHRFVAADDRRAAYADRPLAIGHDQTISQPYIVALMTELAELDAESRVLEVGTGSGYQAAVLAEIAGEVYTIEIIAALARRARATLAELGYDNIRFRTGDGYRGWSEAAPFDAIVVTAAPPRIPEPLKAQLARGGKLVLPVGSRRQALRVITRTATGFTNRMITDVIFVPMTGEAQPSER